MTAIDFKMSRNGAGIISFVIFNLPQTAIIHIID